MTGFITGGTILGSYLCSLIRKCILPGPRKNEILLYALCMSLAAKKQEKWGPAVLQAGSEKHWTLKPRRAFPCSCPLLWKKDMRERKGCTGTLWDSKRKWRERARLIWWNWYPVEEKVVIQWFHLQKEYFACNSAGVSPKTFNIFMNNLPSAIESAFVKTVEELEKVSEKIRIQTNSGMLMTWLGKSLMAQHKKRKNEMPEWERKN